MSNCQPNPIESRGAVGSEAIEALTKIVAGIKESGQLYMATFHELYDLGIIENRWMPQLRTRLLVVAEGAEEFLSEHDCGIAGPHPGEDDMGGAYYLIDRWERPFHVLVSMPKADLSDAAAVATALIRKRDKVIEIDHFATVGFLWVEMTRPTTAEEFVQQFGGVLLKAYDADELMMGREEAISAKFIERSRRREACATSTATPAM